MSDLKAFVVFPGQLYCKKEPSWTGVYIMSLLNLSHCNTLHSYSDFSVKIRTQHFISALIHIISYSWSWETGSQGSFLWSCQTDAARSQSKMSNSIMTSSGNSLGFCKSSAMSGLQKSPYPSIFLKSFYKASHKTIKMIYGCFLTISILNSSGKKDEAETFSKIDIT